uniref:hypothetical protein n=1 Tax=Methanohalobium sp. TaxID=2837493 RepID=UPI0025E59D91
EGIYTMSDVEAYLSNKVEEKSVFDADTTGSYMVSFPEIDAEIQEKLSNENLNANIFYHCLFIAAKVFTETHKNYREQTQPDMFGSESDREVDSLTVINYVPPIDQLIDVDDFNVGTGTPIRDNKDIFESQMVNNIITPDEAFLQFMDSVFTTVMSSEQGYSIEDVLYECESYLSEDGAMQIPELQAVYQEFDHPKTHMSVLFASVYKTKNELQSASDI